MSYQDLINRLCRHALTTRTISRLECSLYNEKYQGTTFLISLGMGWHNRHVILKGLSGSYAYASMRKARDAGWVAYYAQYRKRRKQRSKLFTPPDRIIIHTFTRMAAEVSSDMRQIEELLLQKAKNVWRCAEPNLH